MENQERSDDQQGAQDESVEDFKEEVENDPSTAKSDDEETERLRGG
jgi:hypothetical protein